MKLRKCLAVTALICTVIMSAHAAAAEPRPTTISDDEQLRQQRDEEAELFAAAEGVTLAQAHEYMADTDRIHALDADARAKYADTYAGLTRSPGSSQVNASFTEAAAESARSLAATGPTRFQIRGTTSRFSLKFLESLNARIANDMSTGASGTDAIVSAGVSVSQNSVVLGLSADSRDLRMLLTQRYGPGVSFVAEQPPKPLAAAPTCVSRTNCVPILKGGVELVGTNNIFGVYRCSSAFLGRSNTSGAAVLFTAGHCFANGVQNPVTHSGIEIGPVGLSSLGGSADAQRITVLNPAWTPANRVYFSEANRDYLLTGKLGSGGVGEAANDPMCRTGITTGAACGTLLRTSVTINVRREDGTTVTLTNQRETNICALPGDSGGPALRAGAAHGIVSAGNHVSATQCNATPRSYYTGVPQLESALNARVLL